MLFSSLVLVILGLVLAFAGRRFLVLFVGIAGFMLGYNLVTFFIPGQEGTLQILIGIGVGLVAGFLATRFLKILLWIAGFVLIGSAALAVGNLLGLDGLLVELMLFVVGGIVGIGLVQFAFGTAVILISALAGASMVMNGLPALLNNDPGTVNALIGVVVAVAGFIVQWRFFKDADDPS